MNYGFFFILEAMKALFINQISSFRPQEVISILIIPFKGLLCLSSNIKKQFRHNNENLDLLELKLNFQGQIESCFPQKWGLDPINSVEIGLNARRVMDIHNWILIVKHPCL